MNKNKYNNAWCQNIAKFGSVGLCTAGLLVAGVALASNIHFNAFDADVVGDTLEVTGTLVGLGNKTIDITATLDVEIQATCTPKGNSNKQPFGINKKLQINEDQSIPASAFENGTVDFEFNFELDFDDDVGCPNGNWNQSTVIEDIDLTVTIDQRVGNDDDTVGICELSCDAGSCVVEECVEID
jgi:hypothetical protein